MNKLVARAKAFAARFGLSTPILLAPMAGACPPKLSSAVMSAGGMGACGVLLMQPAAILDWAASVRRESGVPFQLNNWIPEPPPSRDPAAEAAVAKFLGQWGPEVKAEALDVSRADFHAQCDAMIAASPCAISSVMGLFEPAYVTRLKAAKIAWFAGVTTVGEARAAEAAGADVIVAQGAEAGGHRATAEPDRALREAVGLVSLVPAVADAVSIPVVAAGGVADGRTCAAALALGASAVQIGTAFLRCPEAGIAPSWARALGAAAPEDTVLTSVFSGRPGRSLATDYVLAALSEDAPAPAPHPIQRALTAAMRAEGVRSDDLRKIQAWAGQSSGLGPTRSAADLTHAIWTQAQALLQ